MWRSIGPYALSFLTAFVLALLITPAARWLGERLGLVDVPGGRRRHHGIISRMGGLGLYFPFTAAVLLFLLLPPHLQPARNDPKEVIRLAGLLWGCAFMFIFGLLDDRLDLGSKPQFIAQLAVALLSIPYLIIIERVMNPFTNELIIFPWWAMTLLTILWVMGMINTVNFLDGVDGLAAGVAAILCIVLTVHMLREGQYSVAILPLALLGATLGFLPFNFAPAKVFMGSSGSFFLGYAVAALSIIAGAKVATALLVMGLPIVDVAWQILHRWRAGRPIGAGDRGHLHHRLYDLGLSPRVIALTYYLFCLAFGVLALVISKRLYKVLSLLVLAGITLAMLIYVSRRQLPLSRIAHPVAGQPADEGLTAGDESHEDQVCR
ncbi:MAG: glycosyltransferase family 4 protein [Anaerolineae bacterium]